MSRSRRIGWGRVRVPLVWLAALFLVLNAVFGLAPDWVAIAFFILAMAVYLRLGSPPERAPITVLAPVAGRWRALNSPADRVPSHGLNAYGQTWAIDLLAEPRGHERPQQSWWPVFLPPQRFPGFGEPVLAPADGTVVRASDGARDHWSRNSWPALLLMFAEGAVRELAGPSRILGNHVVLDLGGGTYAALAHLQRGSVRVQPGDEVAAGEPLGRCGNSGSSSEPHLHVQLMDDPRVALSDGVPVSFAGFAELPGAGDGPVEFFAPARPAA